MSSFFYLTLSILFSSGVALTMKAANAGKVPFWPLLGINYLVCTICLLAWGGAQTLEQNTPLTWGLSVFIGTMFVFCLWLFNKAISAQGLALSTTLMRLSAVIPTLGSLFFFFEATNKQQRENLGPARAKPLDLIKKGLENPWEKGRVTQETLPARRQRYYLARR